MIYDSADARLKVKERDIHLVPLSRNVKMRYADTIVTFS